MEYKTLEYSTEAIKKFDYLVESNKLISPSNWHEFCKTVKDFYVMLTKEGEDFIPSQYSIADAIDEENYNIINKFLDSCNLGYLENDINLLYTEILCQELPYKVMEVLDNYGIKYRVCNLTQTSNMFGFKCNPAQLTLFKWEDLDDE